MNISTTFQTINSTTENQENSPNCLTYKKTQLSADCSSCFGLCCVALYFSTLDGFPTDKKVGVPCPNLQIDNKCRVHSELSELGYKGCLAFDCFGAGQKVSQLTYKGLDWRVDLETANEMFDVFQVMRQLHELLWYLSDALSLPSTLLFHHELSLLIEETEKLTRGRPEKILKIDLTLQRNKVNEMLLNVSQLVRSETRKGVPSHFETSIKSGKRMNLMARDLRNKDLRGADLRGACLIAADLRGNDLSGTDVIGADFRDTAISGTDLVDCLFLTQAQVNAATGNDATKIPTSLERPKHWSFLSK